VAELLYRVDCFAHHHASAHEAGPGRQNSVVIIAVFWIGNVTLNILE
jgi:hypothetical protein